MTAAPLPAPLPANCPLCNEPITWGDELWIHTDTDRCFLDGTTLHNDEEVRLWNRRAPEAQAWRAESAPTDVRAWDMPPRVQVSFATMGEALDAVPIIRAAFAPPGATPAAPPAREAALVEALRPLAALKIERATPWAEQNEPWPDSKPLMARDEQMITVGDVRRARAALAEADAGRAK